MKKISIILTIFLLCFSLVACDGSKAATSSQTATNESSESAFSEQSSIAASSEKEEISSTVASSEVQTSTSSKVSTSNQTPSNTSSKNQTSNIKPSCSSQKPVSTSSAASTQTESKKDEPYYVGYELVSIDRPITTYKVNGVPLLEKVYGTKYVLQVGDTAIFKIKMSDNGTSGFEVEYSGGCKAEIDSDLLKITATGGREKTDVYIRVDTKEGQKSIQINEFIIDANSDNFLKSDLGMTQLFETYAMRKGLSCAMEGHYAFGGFFTKIENEVHIKIPNNSDWIEEVFNSIDAWVSAGYKKFTLQVVLPSGYTGSGGY